MIHWFMDPVMFVGWTCVASGLAISVVFVTAFLFNLVSEKRHQR